MVAVANVASVLRSKTVTVLVRLVTSESAAEFGSEGNAVDTRGIGNIADHGKGVRVHHHHMGAVRNVQPAGVTIESEIIQLGAPGTGTVLMR